MIPVPVPGTSPIPWPRSEALGTGIKGGNGIRDEGSLPNSAKAFVLQRFFVPFRVLSKQKAFDPAEKALRMTMLRLSRADVIYHDLTAPSLLRFFAVKEKEQLQRYTLKCLNVGKCG